VGGVHVYDAATGTRLYETITQRMEIQRWLNNQISYFGCGSNGYTPHSVAEGMNLTLHDNGHSFDRQ